MSNTSVQMRINVLNMFQPLIKNEEMMELFIAIYYIEDTCELNLHRCTNLADFLEAKNSQRIP